MRGLISRVSSFSTWSRFFLYRVVLRERERENKWGGEEISRCCSEGIDWDGMAKLLVSEEARKEFASLHRTFDEVNFTIQTKFSQEPEPIDWEYYRKGIGSRLVDMYKEAYDSIEILKFMDTVTPQYKPKFEALKFDDEIRNDYWGY